MDLIKISIQDVLKRNSEIYYLAYFYILIKITFEEFSNINLNLHPDAVRHEIGSYSADENQ
jgi:hypothetical protein